MHMLCSLIYLGMKLIPRGLSIPIPDLEGSGMMNPTGLLIAKNVKLLCRDQIRSFCSKGCHTRNSKECT